MSSARRFNMGVSRGPSTFGRAREGGVAVTVGLSIAVLVGSAALALDLGRLYNAVTELDNAADAGAVAAASQLLSGTDSCARAISAASYGTFGLPPQPPGPNDLENVETFASETGGPEVFIDPTITTIYDNLNVRFLSTLVKDANGFIIGDYIDSALGPGEQGLVTVDPADCDNQANFVEVTVDREDPGTLYTVVFDFARVVGAVGQANPRGYAVAGIGRFICGATPFMMCELTGPLGVPPGQQMTFADLQANPEDYRGRGMWLKTADNNTQWGPGDFGFIIPEGGCPGGKCLAERMSADPGLECIGLEGLETEPGATSGARHAFNARFGIFQGGFADPTDPLWQPAAVTTFGKFRRDAGCGISSWLDPDDPAIGGRAYNGLGSLDPLRAGLTDTFNPALLPMASRTGMGMPMDECAYPGGGCTASTNADRLGVACDDPGIPGGNGDCWDAEAYLAVNHDQARTGLASDLDATAFGGSFEEALRDDFMGPGTGRFNGRITRYMVYQWELGYLDASGTYETDPSLWGTVDTGGVPRDHHLVDNITFTKDPASGPPCGAPPCDQMLPEPLVVPEESAAMPDPGVTPHVNEFGGPHKQCYTGNMGNNEFSTILGRNINMKVDRRVIEVVMVNCDPNNGGVEIKGRTTGIDAEGFVQMYVLKPWQVNGNVHEIYAEIIGPINKQVEQQRAVDIVQLYE